MERRPTKQSPLIRREFKVHIQTKRTILNMKCPDLTMINVYLDYGTES